MNTEMADSLHQSATTYDCKCFEELVDLILDNQASQEQIEQFRNKIAVCPTSYSFYDTQKKIHRLLKETFKNCPSCPPSLQYEILQKLDNIQTK